MNTPNKSQYVQLASPKLLEIRTNVADNRHEAAAPSKMKRGAFLMEQGGGE